MKTQSERSLVLNDCSTYRNLASGIVQVKSEFGLDCVGTLRRHTIEMPPTRAESLQHSDVLDLFEEHALRCPEASCVTSENRKISYGELNQLANTVAFKLTQDGLQPGSLVALYLDRSIEFIATILGILKAGAAYLPIDPMIPEQRLAYMLEHSGAAAVVTDASLQSRVAGHRSWLVSELVEADSGSVPGVAHEWSGDDLAYVIYTSGSTGQPKGVEILHRSLALSVEAIRQELDVKPSDTLLAVTSQSFDVSVMEIFLTLSSGAHLVLFPQKNLMQGDRLISVLAEDQVTLLFGTPALWRLLVESGWRGNKKLRGVVGGELLERDLADVLARKTGVLWNHYGPTETTIVATTFRVTAEQGPVPIGFPLPSVRAFVVDGENRPVNPGETGELLIGGEVLASGYRNQPDLTRARFVWLETSDGKKERVYRTGDLVRMRADGAFEFVGRLDNQVKIRGFRIELEDIETTLSRHPDVLECAVVVCEESRGDKLLVAYYRADSDKGITTESLRSFLCARLPLYMVPAHFIELKQFPLTVNGKVDRINLSNRKLSVPEVAEGLELPGDPITRELLAIWRRILRMPAMRPTDNFFELGGHSLLAARLFGEIRSHFGKTLPLATLFECPTVESLAKVIAEARTPEWSPLVPIRTTGTGKPFFCVHPIGGNVLIFKKLSEHMKSRPFYGLQARGLSGLEEAHTSIEAMAADYLASVREVQPTGPYFLGGYSAGGLVAFEMARLLRDAGEQVEMIVLFDTFLHAQSVPTDLAMGSSASLLKPFTGLARRFWQMRHLNNEMRIGVIARDLARLWSTVKLKAYTQLQQVGKSPFQLDTVSGFLFALRNYRPKPLAVDVVLFLADENAPPTAANLPAVWRRLITGNLDVIHLNIDHDRLLDEPCAKSVASMIEERFERQPAAH
jgi:amino acid adenylation domain-containing protein